MRPPGPLWQAGVPGEEDGEAVDDRLVVYKDVGGSVGSGDQMANGQSLGALGRLGKPLAEWFSL